MKDNFQQELLRTQLEIQEQTFKTISQEIHDNIGQVLSLAKLNLNRVEMENPHVESRINDARDLVSKAIQDLRDLSRTLNTENIVSIGLMKAIEMELAMIEKTGLVQTRWQVAGQVLRLEPQKELILFRIVQEALHNIIKHAQATFVSVQAIFKENALQLSISDNGRGFDSAGGEMQGSGLRNMQSRARLIGAEWRINSVRQGGTQIFISLSVENR